MKMLKRLIMLAMVITMAMIPGLPAKAAGELDGQIYILHTNDVHGAIDQYAKVSQYKKDLESKGAFVLLMDAGDFSQGSVHVSEYNGDSAIELMNLVGYNAATLGNHELDYGYEVLKTNVSKMKFDFVVASIKANDVNPFKSNVVYTAPDGTKIGVFGLATPETGTKSNPVNARGLTFAAGDELVNVAKDQVKELKDGGCDIVVCLSHLGIEQESVNNRSVDVLKKVDGIDILIDGHSHSTIEDINPLLTKEGIEKTVVTSTGSNLENIGIIKIENGTISADLISTEGLSEDPTVAARAKTIDDEITKMLGAVFAKSTVDLDGIKENVRTKETNLANLITDAMIWKCQEQGQIVDGAIMNGGSIRDSVSAGDIAQKDIKKVYPFVNTLFIVRVKGSELLEVLEASTFSTPESIGGFPHVAGIKYTIDTTKAFDQGDLYPGSTYYRPNSIQRVSIQSIGGAAFDPDKVYTIAVTDFISSGGDTYYVFHASDINYDLGIDIVETIADYIQVGLAGTVGAEYSEPKGNITIIDREEIRAEPADPPVASDPAPGGKYTVKPGDNLWMIAKVHFNNGYKYNAIYEANRNIIKDPNLIFPGQVLVIPAA